MNNYLSIGDVSKLKGVSIKSLRYYGELGILSPAYINQETGYRYYTMDQLVIVDLICLCIDLDIPLKNFHRYIKENDTLDMEQILLDGQKIADIKIMNLKSTVENLKNMSKHLDISKELKNKDGVYTRTLHERYFLVTLSDDDIMNYSFFVKKITMLYETIKEHNLKMLYNQGVLKHYQNNIINNYVFMELVKPDFQLENVLTIPGGVYQCEIFSNDNIYDAEKKYFNTKNSPMSSIVLAREIYDTKIKSEPTPVEIQVLIE